MTRADRELAPPPLPPSIQWSSDPANLPLLAPKFSLSHLGLSSQEHVDLVSLETQLALVLEGEGDIQDVLKGLEEIERLDKTGVLGAGTLDCESGSKITREAGRACACPMWK